MGPDHLDTARWAENLALAEEGLGRLEPAEKLLLRSHTIRKKSLGDGHSLTRRATTHLGRVCLARGKQDEAVAWLRALLSAGVARTGTGVAMPADQPTPAPPGLADLGQLGEALSGKADPALNWKLLIELSETIQWLTWRSDWLRNYVTALHREAWFRTGLGDKDSVVATIKGAIASMELNQATPADFLVRARACLQRVNESSPDSQMASLAETIRRLERDREEEIKQSHDHSATLFTLNALGAAYWRTKQFDKAIPMFEEELKRREVEFGRTQVETLVAMGNLGVNYTEAGRLTEALPLLEEAYQTGKSNERLAWAGGALVSAYIKAGKTAEAAALIQERLAAAREKVEPGSLQLGQLLADTGTQLLEVREFARAEPILRECLVVREQLAETNQVLPWKVASAKSMLGAALLGRKKYADAEPLLLAGYNGLKKDEKLIPPGLDSIPRALQCLVDLYEATDNKVKAEHWRKELDETKAARSESAKP
jgi:tetratricopeptide (TPR) repeat protein